MAIDPKELKKAKTKISRYEKNFKRAQPFFDDGGGTRFLLGPLYLLVDDIQGAVKHYKWFARKYSDSIDEPLHTLCRAVTFFRTGKTKEAEHFFRRAHLANTYLIVSLIGVPFYELQVRKSWMWDTKEYVLGLDPQFLNIFLESDLNWFRENWNQKEFQEFVKLHITLVEKLDKEPVGPVRSTLVSEISDMREKESRKKKSVKEKRLRLV